MPEDIPHLGDECPYCGAGKLIKHRNAGEGLEIWLDDHHIVIQKSGKAEG